ncbi:hypothetical protein RRG08_017009 [Elysia crispata]|uniref:Uncharacterized protein n=1 Tax=Elysia crispata TaxID=231223 RepID=A0AAE0XYS0_9GAST|nr:hypothetical protein RRG08_017009 [Elysia crispata]
MSIEANHRHAKLAAFYVFELNSHTQILTFWIRKASVITGRGVLTVGLQLAYSYDFSVGFGADISACFDFLSAPSVDKQQFLQRLIDLGSLALHALVRVPNIASRVTKKKDFMIDFHQRKKNVISLKLPTTF